MLAKANTSPVFGLVTNGNEFIFLKLHKGSQSYDWSRVFSILNPGNELYIVFSIIKNLATINISPADEKETSC